MSVTPGHVIHDLRAELESLSWPERFDRLNAAERAMSVADDRLAVGRLREELADLAIAELSSGWEGLPMKECILRLPSKRMRGALTRAAKRARDRWIVQVVAHAGAPLGGPTGWDHRFGVGLDERAVEMPLALDVARLHEPGEVLDAGAALNVPVVRQIVGRPAARLTHFTLPASSEPRLPGNEDRFVYAFGDLRALPFAPGHFTRVVCVSTLEHVGMDNARYTAAAEQVSGSAATAVSELLRVLAPEGELLLTVPYGRAADHGWFRVLDAEGLADLLAPVSAERIDVRFFYYDAGWAEDGPVPPSRVVAAQFLPDIVTGVAVARITRNGVPV